MADFDWTKRPENLFDRYDDGVLGYQAWQRLLTMLREFLQAAEPDPFLAAFDEFLRQLRQINTTPDVCRIFVSHQQADVLLAERIAYLADKQGFEYWLDVHDPLLRLANQTTLPPVVQSVLIAAIIEMALLNCTHGISVQTANAQKSRWVPYEYGRAKRRWLVSTQVASWFDNGIYVTSTADYLKLGFCALSEKRVIHWMTTESDRRPCPKLPARWKDPKPAPLPN